MREKIIKKIKHKAIVRSSFEGDTNLLLPFSPDVMNKKTHGYIMGSGERAVEC